MSTEIPVFHSGLNDYVGLIQSEIASHGICLTDHQRATLNSIADTIIPSISGDRASSEVDEADLSEYHALKPSMSADFVDKLLLVVNNPRFLPSYAAQDFVLALNLLSHRVSTFQLTGYFHPFSELCALDREKAWYALQTSRIYMKRKLAHSLRCLIGITYFACLDETGKSKQWKHLDYSQPDGSQCADVALPRMFNSNVQRQLADRDTVTSGVDEKEEITKFLHRSVTHASRVMLNCDVVVVGSGSGGGTVAEYLKKGLSVLVLEQGGQFPNSLTNTSELTDERAFKQKYESGGFLQTTDGSMAILAGRTVGGGSAINWGCCLSPPLKLRETWSRLGLPLFLSGLYEECIKDVEQSMQVHTYNHTNHNGSNAQLLHGARKAGIMGASTGQNSPPEHDCGTCCFGCSSGLKNGTNVNSLPKSEATVLANCTVQRVTTRAAHGTVYFEDVHVNSCHVSFKDQLGSALHHEYDKEATGVEATVAVFDGERTVSIPIEVSAKIVVVAGGSLNSPLLLKRSGLDNAHVGAHQKLHPVCGVVGEFEEPEIIQGMTAFGADRLHRTQQRKVYTWQGNPMTAVVPVGEDEQGHCARQEVPCIHPGLGAFAIKWGAGPHAGTELYHGREYKRAMQNFANLVPLIVLTRDLGEGSVDGLDTPQVTYTIHDYDKQSMLLGIQQACKILVAAGAAIVHAPQIGIAPFRPNKDLGLADPAFHAFLADIRQQGVTEAQMGLFSAHQMGTCRMARIAEQGVVAQSGEVFGVRNLFIADASVFPSSSGVNPMITTMATARLITAFINERLNKE